jgi:hypothetical protein
LEKTVIDFEELAVGVRKIASISVINKSNEVANLTMDVLPIQCGFNLINALRPVEPLGALQMQLTLGNQQDSNQGPQ